MILFFAVDITFCARCLVLHNMDNMDISQRCSKLNFLTRIADIRDVVLGM